MAKNIAWRTCRPRKPPSADRIDIFRSRMKLGADDRQERDARSRTGLALPAFVLSRRVRAMAIAQSPGAERGENESRRFGAGNSRSGFDPVANDECRNPKSRSRFHVDHARFAKREQDREATFAFVGRRCPDAGLQ